MNLRKQLKDVKIQNAETIQSYFTRVSQIKERLEEECVPEGSDYFQQTMERTHSRRRSSTHNKRREDGSNWRSSSHHPKKIPQAMRNMKISTLEEPLIHLSIWIRNNEEDDEVEGSRRSLPMKQIKISIQLSFHDIVFVIFSWCIMHDRMFALMTI